MAPTHVAVGLVLAAAVAAVDPSLAGPAVAGGVVGSLLPDLDLFAGTHRRTLHAPVLGWLPAAGLALVAWVAPSSLTVGLAVAATAAAVHAGIDIAGAGEELRPWERTNTDAVYNHVTGRWIRGRYWIRYDGAPEDAVLALALLAVAVWRLGDLILGVAAVTALVAVVYTLVRKRMPKYVAPLVE